MLTTAGRSIDHPCIFDGKLPRIYGSTWFNMVELWGLILHDWESLRGPTQSQTCRFIGHWWAGHCSSCGGSGEVKPPTPTLGGPLFWEKKQIWESSWLPAWKASLTCPFLVLSSWSCECDCVRYLMLFAAEKCMSTDGDVAQFGGAADGCHGQRLSAFLKSALNSELDQLNIGQTWTDADFVVTQNDVLICWTGYAILCWKWFIISRVIGVVLPRMVFRT